MSAATLAVHLSDDQLDALADRIAERLAPAPAEDRWLSTTAAAAHVGCHPDTIRKAAAERVLPAAQNGPNCRLHFRRSDLDAWRGGQR